MTGEVEFEAPSLEFPAAPAAKPTLAQAEEPAAAAGATLRPAPCARAQSTSSDSLAYAAKTGQRARAQSTSSDSLAYAAKTGQRAPGRPRPWSHPSSC